MSQVIERAASIMRALQQHPEGLALSEIAEAANLPRSSTHRLVNSLKDQGIVAVVSGGRKYRLGPMLMQIASAANSYLLQAVRPFLKELSEELNETVDLAILTGAEISFVDKATAQRPLLALSKVGLSYPAYCTANGKALLAEMPDDAVRKLVGESFEGLNPSTVTTIDALLDQLAAIRLSGIAFDREEHNPSISAAAVALRNPYGLAAAMSIPVPTTRFVDREGEIVERALLTKSRIEEHLLQVSSETPAHPLRRS